MISWFRPGPAKCFCAFCRHERTVQRKKGVSWINVALGFVLALSTTFVLFDGPDPRGFLLLACFVVLGEIFLILRWRLALTCPICGFDPALYLRDPEKASEKVRRTLEQKRNDPDALLIGKNPFSLLPIQKVPAKGKGKTNFERLV